MKRTVCCLLLSVVSLLADVSGKWSGSFDVTGPDGETKADTAFLNLKQDGNKITGTAGPNEEHQFDIKTGKIDGDKIALEVELEDGNVLTFDLALAEEHIKGDVKGQMGDQKMTAKLDVTRVK
jgi:hypothetical protein